MSDTYDPTDVPVRRGRRDPHLAVTLEAENQLGGPGPDADEQNDVALLPGDIIMVKVTHQIEIQGDPSWFAYGIQTRVMDYESEEDAFIRAASVVNTRVLDLASDAEERVNTYRSEQYRRNRRIQPRG